MFLVFFFNDTATTEIYTLSLHDALPICFWPRLRAGRALRADAHLPVPQLGLRDRRQARRHPRQEPDVRDRKSTRLNSSHANISYAVFCLKKKKKTYTSFSHCI